MELLQSCHRCHQLVWQLTFSAYFSIWQFRRHFLFIKDLLINQRVVSDDQLCFKIIVLWSCRIVLARVLQNQSRAYKDLCQNVNLNKKTCFKNAPTFRYWSALIIVSDACKDQWTYRRHVSIYSFHFDVNTALDMAFLPIKQHLVTWYIAFADINTLTRVTLRLLIYSIYKYNACLNSTLKNVKVNGQPKVNIIKIGKSFVLE